MRGEKVIGQDKKFAREGSPPHARGKGFLITMVIFLHGITPACAGKSICIPPCVSADWDHPRMRGEKLFDGLRVNEYQGSPPHARGKDQSASVPPMFFGITPACAGKSRPRTLKLSIPRDHPRMRGEKALERA